MDLQDDFTNETITLTPDYEGDVIATLISSKNNKGNRGSLLYLHGYIDYFFHPHVSEQSHANGLDFYALDLRKYGRSLLEHQHPNYCKTIEEYYEELSIVLRKIKNENKAPLHILAHSTGGLIASNYMNNGEERHLVSGLILNSPFLNLNQPRILKSLSSIVSRGISRLFPYAKVNGALASVYAKSIHQDFYGEWDFNLDLKPIKGFPTYFKWVVAVMESQKKLEQSKIEVPILVMHASKSAKISTFSEEAMRKDIVLNVDDIKRIGMTLGENVTLLEIEDAQHDILLSSKEVRTKAFEKLFDWLAEN
ncbi:alpha/beta hydrolase [Changchengzhania lutea]|uniref:alpha/beta hydrolase n=1 Tax=Changchengzhania lutea TaxID=2049305 RepID=UPI00115CE8D5|nr:alpha/beta hydrolase [Changchengzhania lutea]